MYPTRFEFAEILMSGIPQSSSAGSVRLDYDQYALRVSSPNTSSERTILLDNCYREYCTADESRRDDLLSKYRSALVEVEIPSSFKDASVRLLPFVQTRAFWESANYSLALKGEPRVPFALLTEDIGVGLVYDSPVKMNHINQARLDGWNTDFIKAYMIALQNLRTRTTPSFQKCDAVYIGHWDDAYAMSRLALPEVFAGLRVKGLPVAVAFDAGTVAVTGSEDAQGLAAITGTILRMREEKGLMINMPFIILERNEWKPFKLDPFDAMYEFVNFVSVTASLHDNEQQEQWLSQSSYFETNGLKIGKVGPLEEMETGKICTGVNWIQGRNQLMPVGDVVLFIKRNANNELETVRAASWQAVERVMGPKMLRTDLYPTRFVVTEFPTEKELQEIFRSDPETADLTKTWSVTDLSDPADCRLLALQMRVRPCPGTIPVKSIECKGNRMLQRYKSPVPAHLIADFYLESLKDASVSNEKEFTLIGAAGATQDVYVGIMPVPGYDSTAVFVEVHLLTEKEMLKRIRALESGQTVRLPGPSFARKF